MLLTRWILLIHDGHDYIRHVLCTRFPVYRH
jgi:hypothetical protein